jgi:hypothetical protein
LNIDNPICCRYIKIYIQTMPSQQKDISISCFKCYLHRANAMSKTPFLLKYFSMEIIDAVPCVALHTCKIGSITLSPEHLLLLPTILTSINLDPK